MNLPTLAPVLSLAVSRRIVAIACVCAGLAGLAAVACGDGGDDEGATATTAPASSTPGGTGPTATPTRTGNQLLEPELEAPVSQYSILVQDLGIQNFRTDLSVTATLTLETYAMSTSFTSEDDGRERLEGWGYLEGYRTGLLPEGGAEAMLQGAYVIYQELHRYESTDGAHAAFEYLAGNVRENTGAEIVTIETFANESIASRGISGKIGSSNIDQVLHQVIFRRGNTVAVVLTIGAEPLMDVVTALELCGFIDTKMLNERPHPSPTPTPPRSPSPSPSATTTPSP
jgi:hypothetical protein